MLKIIVHIFILIFYLFFLLYFTFFHHYFGMLDTYKKVFMSVNYFTLIYLDIMYFIIKNKELRKTYYYIIANNLLSLSIIYFFLISINFVYNTFSIDLKVEEPEKDVFVFFIICLSTIIFFYHFLCNDIKSEKINNAHFFIKKLFFSFCGLLCLNVLTNNLINFYYLLNNFQMFNKCLFEITYFILSTLISIFYCYCLLVNKKYFTELKYAYMQLSNSTLIFFVVIIC
ncbi:membrane protein, partial [Candidatus Magnetomorum sp. HK-1]